MEIKLHRFMKLPIPKGTKLMWSIMSDGKIKIRRIKKTDNAPINPKLYKSTTSKAGIERIKRLFSEDSDTYRIRVLGQPPSDIVYVEAAEDIVKHDCILENYKLHNV